MDIPSKAMNSHVRVNVDIHRLGSLPQPVLLVIVLLDVVLSLLDRTCDSDTLPHFWQEAEVNVKVGKILRCVSSVTSTTMR